MVDPGSREPEPVAFPADAGRPTGPIDAAEVGADIAAGVMLAGLCLPAASLAGTYSWDLPANFTTSPPGANPDHDPYGATPWRYLEGAASLLPVSHSHDPSGFSLLPQFAPAGGGGVFSKAAMMSRNGGFEQDVDDG